MQALCIHAAKERGTRLTRLPRNATQHQAADVSRTTTLTARDSLARSDKMVSLVFVECPTSALNLLMKSGVAWMEGGHWRMGGL
jgi:hypothetical protein